MSQRRYLWSSQFQSECLEAFERGNKRVAQRLLLQVRQPAYIRTTSDYAVIVNSIEIFVAMVSSLLHLAAVRVHGWMDVVIALITKYNCDANCRNYWGCTPLHYASSAGHLEVVKYFIKEQHCDPMTKDVPGQTPLHSACQYGHLSIAQYLINEHHCDPMTKDNQDQTPLHYACHYGHLNIAQYLINEHHCDPMNKDNWDQTPLHYACQSGYAHIVQYLLSTGKVDPLARDDEGKTPMYYAAANWNNYQLLKHFRSFPQFKRDFPVHTYTKLVLTGYSGTGKTTTSQLILLLANEAGFFSALSSGRVTDVECFTAGIIYTSPCWEQGEGGW